jgi:hypothetical protein
VRTTKQLRPLGPFAGAPRAHKRRGSPRCAAPTHPLGRAEGEGGCAVTSSIRKRRPRKPPRQRATRDTRAAGAIENEPASPSDTRVEGAIENEQATLRWRARRSGGGLTSTAGSACWRRRSGSRSSL